MIYKFQPFSTSKDLGLEYNAHCRLVPNPEDFILILDYDAMLLTPRTYQVIERAIKAHPEYDVYTAVTNRIGYDWQRAKQFEVDANDSIRHHIAQAERYADEHPSMVTPVPSAAGFFMLFRKSYWERNPFQERIYDSSGNLFDWNFCLEAFKANRVGLICGAYVWHSYRLMKEEFRNTDHLL